MLPIRAARDRVGQDGRAVYRLLPKPFPTAPGHLGLCHDALEIPGQLVALPAQSVFVFKICFY